MSGECDTPVGALTPTELDRLLREAAGAVLAVPPGRIPAPEPRRTPEGKPGEYATALPLRMARAIGRSPRELAAGIAAELRTRPGVAEAVAEGKGFVNLTPTPAARAALVRAAAGNRAYLLGATGDPGGWVLPAPSPLRAALTLSQAYAWARGDARARVAACHDGVPALPGSRAPRRPVTWRDPDIDDPNEATEPGRLLAVVGEASARVAFCRAATDTARPEETTGEGLPALPVAERPGAWVRTTAANPAFRMRYAHAHAHATRYRWAPDAGYAATPDHGPEYSPPAVAALDTPAARALAGALFDGPGTVTAAHRRARPHILVRYLEELADLYHGWRESSPAVPAGGAVTDGAAAVATAARLDLCAAVAGALAAGMLLIGVSAPTVL